MVAHLFGRVAARAVKNKGGWPGSGFLAEGVLGLGGVLLNKVIRTGLNPPLGMLVEGSINGNMGPGK